jgi:hypothetical protein
MPRFSRPQNIPDPSLLVVLKSTSPRDTNGFSVAPGVYQDWRDRSTCFEHPAAAWNTSQVLSRSGPTRNVAVLKASADLFPVLGLNAIAGRTFDDAATRPGAERVALIDAGFWQRELGGRADILGRPLILDDQPYTVVGIVPPLRLGIVLNTVKTDVWVPLTIDRNARGGGPQ